MKALYKLEKQINAILSQTAPERRPMLSSRRRAQSVAACARGFEATDGNGNIECITVQQGLAWASEK